MAGLPFIVVYFIVIFTCVNGIRIEPDEWVEGKSGSIICTHPINVELYNASVLITNCPTVTASAAIPCYPALPDYATVTVNVSTNTLNLTIADISRTRDSGVWRCTNVTNTVNIDVKVGVSSVSINNRNSLIFTDQQITPVTCEAGVSNPFASITWSIGGRNLGSGTTTNNADGTTTSILQYTADTTDHNKILQCSATNGYGSTKTDSIILNIRFGVSSVSINNRNSLIFTDQQITSVTCQTGVSNPYASITWSIGGRNLGSGTTTNNSDGTTTSILQYTADTTDHNKTLQCSATIDYGSTKTDSIILNIRFDVSSVSINNRDSLIFTDQQITPVTCQTGDSNPFASITWSIGGRNLGSGTITNNTDGTTTSILQYTANKTEHNKALQCSATNGVGTNKTDSIILDIRFGVSSVSINNRNSLIFTDQQLTSVTCQTGVSNPHASITWSIGGNNQAGGTTVNNTDGTTTSILQYRAEKTDHNKTLQCSATNGVGTNKTDSIILYIRYLDPVTISSNRLEVSEDEGVNITCSTDSNPVASITWYNGSATITTIQSNTDTFIIDRAICLDTAVYSCHVTNTEIPDRQFNQSASVFVRCSPRLDTTVDIEYNVSGSITDAVQLVADVIAYPAPSFTWYYTNTTTGGLIPISTDGLYQQIDVNTSINTFRSTLNISISSNIFYRSYIVNVTNDGGSTNLIFDVKAQTVPDPPSYITYSTHGTDRICVDWRAGFNGGSQQQFIVQHSTDDKSWTDSTTISASNYCIENLQPDTLYYIRVVARNKYGDSQPVYLLSEQGTVLPTRTSKTASTTPYGLIGGIAGGVVALILIIIIAVIIVKKRRNAAKETERIVPNNEKAGDTTTREDDMIVDINLEYVSADQLHGASGGAAGDADGGTVNETTMSSSVDHSQKEPLYAEVDKSKNNKTNTKLTADKTPTNQVYAQVNKSKKDQSKKTTSKPQKMPKPQTKLESKNKTPTREVYENVGIFGDFKGDPDELTTNKTNTTPQKAEKKGEDLVYADLDFVAHKPSSGVLRKDEEGGVEYAGIDYTKRGPTPPPSSDSSDDD